MGLSQSCLRQSSSTHKTLTEVEMKHDRSSCSGMSFMMFGCFRDKETEDQRQKLQQQNKTKEKTLEDCLIASPAGLQKINGTGGEYHVFKQSSRRVFPSSVGENNANSCSKPRKSLSKERLLKVEEIEREYLDEHKEVSLSRSQSGKSKKRVSFRVPEEADIFIFNPSSEEEYSGEKET